MLRQDVIDAFGPLPKAAETLFALTELRIAAADWSIQSIISRKPDLIFALEDLSKLGPLLSKAPGSVRPVDHKSIHLRLPPAYFDGDTLLTLLRNLLVPKPENNSRHGNKSAATSPSRPAGS